MFVRAIFEDSKKILPLSTLVDGYYGLSDITLSIPVKIGKSGIEGISEIALLPTELVDLKKSADQLQHYINKINF